MPPLDPLSALAVKYGSDKWSSKHSYTAWYYEQFKDRRASVRKVVEIGVGEGASLRMWEEFFPNAEIWGADIDWSRLINAGRIHGELCDQSRLESLEILVAETGADVDLFIDDGSHLPAHQLKACVHTMPQLWRGVKYVIEDVAYPSLIELLPEYDCHMPTLEHRNRYDNRLLVVEHKCPA